jgi:uncharacterized protein (TIGR03435 family)
MCLCGGMNGAWIRGAALAAAMAAAGKAADGPKFEVVSIKPCKAGEPPQGRKGGRGGGRIGASPGRLNAECATLAMLIRSAYLQFPNGQRAAALSPRVLLQEIKGSPSWIDSERFTIEAKGDGPQANEMVRGPMLQALLEDRFRLKIHRETRETPIYELKTGKGGPKFRETTPGACVTLDRDHPPPEPLPKICGGFAGNAMYGTTIANFCRQLSAILDRDVVDRTGLTGTYDLHFDWSQDELAAAAAGGGDAPPVGPARLDFNALMEAAIPRLGLRLEAAKGSGEFLVIDHVERPTAN